MKKELFEPETLNCGRRNVLCIQLPGRDHAAALQILDDQTNTNVNPYTDPDRGDPLPGFNTDRTFWEIDLSLRKRMSWLTGVGGSIQRHPPAAETPFVVIAPPTHKDDDPSCGPSFGGSA